MIKKGMLATGIAAAAPIVTTFNVPALAAGSQNSYRFYYTIAAGTGVATIANAATSTCTTPTGWASATNGTAADATALGLTVTADTDRTPAVLNFADDTPDFDFTAAGIRYDTNVTTCSNFSLPVITNGGNTATITPAAGQPTVAVYFVVNRQ